MKKNSRHHAHHTDHWHHAGHEGHKHSVNETHPHHRGAGMSAFNDGHWQYHPKEAMTYDTRYGSEMHQEQEYMKSESEMANYCNSHRAKH